MGVGASRWKKRLVRMITMPCASFSNKAPHYLSPTTTISTSAANNAREVHQETGSLSAKSLCTICLEPLSCSNTADTTDGQTIFTAECAHTFHFACIASNVRHGSLTCPICRAQWSVLPREHLSTISTQSTATDDPILRILEDSIATSRVNRRSSLRAARLYDDDDPIDPPRSETAFAPRLNLTLIPTTMSHRLYLSVKLAYQNPTDLVLVVSPNGPHLRLLKQAISLVIFSLHPSDRLAIVTYSAVAATRTFPLRRMSPHGKRSALRIVDRLLYLGMAADPVDGIRKGMKIIEDRSHRNRSCCILHLSDSPALRDREFELHIPVPVHWFHVGFGFGASNGFVMHEFEELLGRLMGGIIRDTRVRIGPDGEWVRLGEVRGGEERRIPLLLRGDSGYVCVWYTYIEGEEQVLVAGEAVVGLEEKEESGDDGEREMGGADGRMSSGERWEYLDPFMARRWAKHLHRA